MSIKNIGLISLGILTIATIALLWQGSQESGTPSASNPPLATLPTPTPAASPMAGNSSQPADAQPEQSGAAVPPVTPVPDGSSPEEMAEDDEALEREQINAALAQLSSADTAQRVEGAEQLGAYPTREAEAALLQVLVSDSEADVRSAAAQSLGYVEKPTDATLNGLLSALEDQNEDVRLNALSTLEDFLLGSEENSKRYKKILAGLKTKADARSVPQETRDAIHDILQDLTAPSGQ